MRRWLDDLNAAISRAPRYSELSALSLQQPVLQAPGQNHRPNTLSHVCWYRNQSVSLTDHITMMENQLSGYLLRKFKNSNGWQRLWVIFTNFCLYFYKTHQEDAPLASLPLLGYTVSIPSFSDPVTCRHVFKLHFKSHVYFFRADSDYTWRRWMEVIRRGVSSPGKIGHLAEDGVIVDWPLGKLITAGREDKFIQEHKKAFCKWCIEWNVRGLSEMGPIRRMSY